MKVYRFYKKLDDFTVSATPDVPVADKYPVYAFTNDKKMRDKFIETRNLDKFYYFKSDMDKDEWIEYANTNRGSLLDNYYYRHYTRKYPNRKTGEDRKYTDVYIVSTWMEKESTEACAGDCTTEINEDLNYNFFPFALKKKYVKALETLQFISLWKFHADMQRYDKYMTDDEIERYADYSYPDLTFDELGMFIQLFGDLLK